MAVTAHVYGSFQAVLSNKEVNLTSDTLKVMLFTGTPTQATDKYKSAITTEISGTGYTAGGATLSGVTLSLTGEVYKLTATSPSWTSASFTANYAAFYDSTPATDATRPLIAFVDFGGAVTVTAGTFAITIDPAGIATWTAA